MARPIIFGEIEEIEEGHWFAGRQEMMPTSFHRKWGSGIDGNGKEGTSAIVLSGGYEDDKDLGDEIIYTGAGGNDHDFHSIDTLKALLAEGKNPVPATRNKASHHCEAFFI